MIIYRIDLEVEEGREEQVEKIFRDEFVPAVRSQPGFCNALYLSHGENESTPEILLFFDTEKQRKAWVDTEQHREAWGKISGLCSSYTAQGYELTEKAR